MEDEAKEVKKMEDKKCRGCEHYDLEPICNLGSKSDADGLCKREKKIEKPWEELTDVEQRAVHFSTWMMIPWSHVTDSGREKIKSAVASNRLSIGICKVCEGVARIVDDKESRIFEDYCGCEG